MLESDTPNQELKDLLVKLDGQRYSSGDGDGHRGLSQQEAGNPYTDSEGILTCTLYTVHIYSFSEVLWLGSNIKLCF